MFEPVLPVEPLTDGASVVGEKALVAAGEKFFYKLLLSLSGRLMVQGWSEQEY